MKTMNTQLGRQAGSGVVNRRVTGPAPMALQKHGVTTPFAAQTHAGVKMFTPGDAFTGSGVAFKPPKKPVHPVKGKGPGGVKMAPGGSPSNVPAPPPPQTPPGVPPANNTNPWLDDFNNNINAQIASQKAMALKNQRDLLIGFGSQSLARQYLGNDPVVSTISDDPNSQSWLGRNAYTYGQNQKNTNESLNAGNLFYGGARTTALTELAHQNLAGITDQTQNVQSQLNQFAFNRDQAIAQLIREKIAQAIQSQGGGGN